MMPAAGLRSWLARLAISKPPADQLLDAAGLEIRHSAMPRALRRHHGGMDFIGDAWQWLRVSADAIMALATLAVLGFNAVLLRHTRAQTKNLAEQLRNDRESSNRELENVARQLQLASESHVTATKSHEEALKTRLDEFAPKASVRLYDDGKPDFVVYRQGNPKHGWIEVIDSSFPNPLPREVLNNYMVDVVVAVLIVNHGAVPCRLNVSSCYGINFADVGIRTIGPGEQGSLIHLTCQRKGVDWLNDPLFETTFTLAAQDPWGSVEDRHVLDIAIRPFANENGGLKLLQDIWTLTPGLAKVTREYNPSEMRQLES